MTLRRTSRWAAAWIVWLGLVFASVDAAHAQSVESKAIAESLFREGRALMEQGRTAEACRKLEESQRLDPALGTLLNLAVCHEEEGKIATAWAEFNEAMVQARREGRQDRFDLAAERVAALEPKLPRLAISVPQDNRVSGLEITRNGTPLGSGAWNTALPIDPGEVVIEARAPSYRPYKTTISIALKESKSVEIPALEPEPTSPPPPVAPSTASTAAAGTVGTEPPAEEWWTTSRVAGVTVLGVGVAAVAVGGVFGFDALRKNSQADDYCSGTDCTDQRGVDLSEDARQSARISDFTMGAGIAAAAVGTILILSGGPGSPAGAESSAHRRGFDLSLSVAPSTAGAGVSGTW